MSFDPDDMPIGVNIILLDKNNNVLLGKRSGDRRGSGNWSLIGGKLKKGESIEDTAQRELKEEINIDVAKEDIYTVNMSTSIDSDGTQFILIGTVVNSWNGEIENMEKDKCDELRFFPLNELPENMFYATKSNLELFLSEQFYDPYFNTNNADLEEQCQQ